MTNKLIFLLLIGFSHILYAGNLDTCLSGKYVALCDHSALNDNQRKQTELAELRENYSTCISGRYVALCKHELLTKDQYAAVIASERRENLQTCMSGRYVALCKHELLTAEQSINVARAERTENLNTCLAGRYAAICNHSLLSSSEAQRVADAERQNQSNARTSQGSSRPSRKYTSQCESGHWVSSVSSDGEIVKLEDGSVWEVDRVDTIDTMLWLPTTDIVVCDGKLINTEDNETASARRLK